MSRFNYTTKTRKILADLYTPVGVYMRLRDIYPQSALMESSDYHGSENSRSFIGVHPMASIAVGHGIVTVTYPDMVNNRWTTRKMYPGDRTATPYHLDPNTGLPTDYINCKVNIIDCGEPF